MFGTFRKLGGVLLLLLAMFVAGFALGQEAAQTPAEAKYGVDLAPFWEVWELLDERFVNTTKDELPTREQRIEGAISGLVRSFGDPNSAYMKPVETENFREEVLGEFGGVGMEIDKAPEGIVVISPLRNTPAEEAGLKPGDLIIAIDGESAVDMSIDEAVERIRGEIGSAVELTIYRESSNDVFDAVVVRDSISVPTLETEELPGGITIIRVFNFFGTVDRQFASSVRTFNASSNNKLILDLRGNPGGFLDAAVDMASWFLPEGTVIVREANDEEEEVLRSRGYDIFDDTLKMVILVDGGSASASEIVAGALQEHGIAKLVGTQTFGKGSVQEIIKVNGKSSLRLTIAKWLTPNGVSISRDGLTPDYVVEYSDEAFLAGEDPQLDKAIELLMDAK